jgi:hypothetical protein
VTRLDHDCAWATAKAVLDMVGHLLREEEQKEFFSMTVAAVEACLIKRDELLARERKRLAKPSSN